MRVTSRLLVLATLLILLSGSLVKTNQSVALAPSPHTSANLEHLLAEQAADLEDYRLRLEQAGEDIFAEKQGELRRAQMQKLKNEAKALQAQKTEELRELEADLSAELLRQQLQLMLVSLDEHQQEARFEKISQVQQQLEAVQDGLNQELQEQLLELEAVHEERGRDELVNLQVEVERAMQDELANYRIHRLQELEEEIAKLGSASRSTLANR